MGRSGRARAFHDGKHSRSGQTIAERNRARKHLWLYEMAVSQGLTQATHLWRTSIITIAKAKISASLLYVPSSLRISGAVHRAV